MAEGPTLKIGINLSGPRMLGCSDEMYGLLFEAVTHEFTAFEKGWLDRARAVVDFVENGHLLIPSDDKAGGES